ncbi:PLD-like domain protein, partial [Chlamydia psittaci C1/97]
RILRSRYTVT